MRRDMRWWAHVLGLRVLGVSIERDGDSFGRTFYNYAAPWLEEDKLPDGRERGRVEAYVLCYLAGAEAEARFAGRRDRVGATGDLESAAECAWQVVLSEEELEVYLRWLVVRARHLVGLYWSSVEALAKKLLRTQNMSVREVNQAIQTLACARRSRRPTRRGKARG